MFSDESTILIYSLLRLGCSRSLGALIFSSEFYQSLKKMLLLGIF